MKRILVAALALAPAFALGSHVKGPTRFTVIVENVSTPQTLKLSTGGTAPAPNSPVLWVVHTHPGVLFTKGHYDHGVGLEALAEDGDPGPLDAHLRAGGERGVVASGAAAIPVGDDQPGPALPGKRFEFSFEASPGDRLTIATMFGQSNDVWIGNDDEGIALFDGRGKPLAGDLTARLSFWDAGTEVNEEPGVGPNQAPRQPAPNTGPQEHRRIGPVNDGFTYPPVGEVVRVTIAPQAKGVATTEGHPTTASAR
jgi:hypothetical protein